MARRLGALREALIGAGATPARVDKAGEALAGYENRLSAIDLRLERLSGDIRVVQAMGGVMIALLAGVVWRLFER
jgi:hypothetical protein